MKRSVRNLSWGLAGALIAAGTLTEAAMAAPDGEQFEFSAQPDKYGKRIHSLEEKEHLENNRVKLSKVLDEAGKDKADKDTHRHTPHGDKCGKDIHPKEGFCWNRGDNQNPEWFPQGLTASWDAFENGTYEGRTVIAASWYLKKEKLNSLISTLTTSLPVKEKEHSPSAVRVTFTDRNKNTYDHVVLAKPTKGGKDIAPLRGVHAGGLAWVGRPGGGDHAGYLYVSDTDRGLRVFDLDHIWKADKGSHDYKVADGKVSAGGYHYVLPQIGYYKYSKKVKVACNDSTSPVQSSVSIDRKTKTLVTGEFCGNKGNGEGRIVRWPLESKGGELTGLLKEANNKVESDDWYRSDLDSMQGVATQGDHVWMTASFGKDHKGKWYKASLAGLKTGGTLRDVHASTMCTQGPEDLSYKSEDSVWTLTEYADERQVFPIQESNQDKGDCTKDRSGLFD